MGGLLGVRVDVGVDDVVEEAGNGEGADAAGGGSDGCEVSSLAD